MRAHFLTRTLPERRRLVLEIGVPVDRCGFEAEQVEPLHRRCLAVDQLEQVLAPVGDRADDHPRTEALLGVGEEGGEVVGVERAFGVVALALDRGQLAVAPFSHDVDAVVAAVVSRPIVPAPDRAKAVAELAVGAKYLRDKRLELSPALPWIGVAVAEVRVDFAEGC